MIAAVAIGGAFLGLMISAHLEPLSLGAVLGTSCWVLLAGLGLGWCLDYVVKWFVSPLKPRLYVIPFYVLETRFEEVRWWPILAVNEFKVTHQVRSGFHEFSSIDLRAGDSCASFAIASEEACNRLLATLQQNRAGMLRAAESEDWGFFERNDDFRGVTGDRANPGRFGSRSKGMAAVTASVFAIYALVVLSKLPPQSPSKNVSHPLIEKRFQVTVLTPGWDRGEEWVLGHDNEAALAADVANFKGEYENWLRTHAVQPLPVNGAVERFHTGAARAPFEVHTRGADRHYLVKLVWASSGEGVATVFIRAGQSVKIEVPLGTMRMRYAAGPANQPWYGDTILFGPSTEFFEADSDFVFSREGERIEGYTVELFLQRDGNLQKRKIAPEQW